MDLVVDLNQFVYDEAYGLTEDELADVYPAVLELGSEPGWYALGLAIQPVSQRHGLQSTWAQELGFDAAPTTPEELKDPAVCSR